jgi:hypothetical protein
MAFRSEEDGGTKKPAGFKHSYTREQILELAKCSEDPIYFIETYIKIVQKKTGKLIPFKLWDFQKRLISNYIGEERIISLCPRQVGKTETTAAFLLWWCCFKERQDVLIAANKLSSALEIMRRFKQMYEELPWFIKPGLMKDNETSVVFDNRSLIEAQATTKSTGRGRALSLLYVDEFAFVEPNIQEEFFASIQPTLATSGGKFLITSTPNSDEDVFSRIWNGAEDAPNSFKWVSHEKKDLEGITLIEDEEEYETVYEDPSMLEEEIDSLGEEESLGGFKRFFVHWQEPPGRDEKYKKKTLKEGVTLDRWYREYECRFHSADPTLINQNVLMKLAPKKPRYIDKYGVKWFENVRPGYTHCVIMDPSEGASNDNSVIEVFSIPDMKQVAEWASNVTDQVEQTKMLLRILKKIYNEQQSHPHHFGESYIYYSVECNGIGKGIITAIELAGEENFPGELIDSDGNKSRGIRTTESSKRDYCLRLKTLIEHELIKPASKELISEIKTFVQRGKSFEAKPGTKDDRVMCCVLMCFLFDEVQYYEEELEERLNVPVVREVEVELDLDEEDDSFLPVI